MSRSMMILVFSLVLLAGILPIFLYWLVFGNAPALSASQALTQLNAPDSNAILIDVRSAQEFAAGHVDGSINYPLDAVSTWRTPSDLPAPLQGKTIIVICQIGWNSVKAVRYLRSIGVQAYNVTGGLQAWAKEGYAFPNLQYSHFAGEGKSPYLSLQVIPPGDQIIEAVAYLFIKPTYMLISLALGLLLFRRAARDLSALGWGMLIFLAGEIFCYINVLVFKEDSFLSEYLHSYGMVVGFGFVFYALMEGVDNRILHYNQPDKKCLAASLCGTCARYQPVACRARRLYQLITMLVAFLALMPLTARLDLRSSTGLIYGFPFYFGRFAVYQLYENWILPVEAIFLAGLAFIPLLLKKQPAVPTFTQVCLSGAMAALSFSFLRLSLGMIYASNLAWFTSWEELTELLFVVAAGAVLWVFRRSLFPDGLLDKRLVEYLKGL